MRTVRDTRRHADRLVGDSAAHYVRQELLKEGGQAGPARQVRFVARDGDACEALVWTVLLWYLDVSLHI